MGTTGTLLYSLSDLGFESVASMQARMLVPPVPKAVLGAFGLRVTSDAPNAPPPGDANRQIVVSFVPSGTATGVTTLGPKGGLATVLLTGNGLDYILPPIIQFPPPLPANAGVLAMAEAFLIAKSATVVSGGAAYSATPHVALIGGLPPRGYRRLSTLCVSGLRILARGKKYTTSDTIQIVENATPQPTVLATGGSLVVDAAGGIIGVTLTDMGAGYIRQPKVIITSATGSGANITCDMAEGTPQQATATVALGVITGITLGAAGDGYIGVPDIVVTDPTGSGFVGVARMGVGRVAITRPGNGYVTPPTITFTPFYQYTFPTAATQAAPLVGLMRGYLEDATMSPVQETPPVIT